jgi:hypothetical protein
LVVTCLALAIEAVATAGAPAGKVVWKAGFENGDAYPEINNFGRDVAEKVGGVKSLHSRCTWQTAVKHSGQYAEREHTTRDPSAAGPGSTHRAYCFQSWRSTNGAAIPTPIVVTAWVYIEKFDTNTWTSFITLISTPTPDFPSGSIITLDMGQSRELTIWYQPRHQAGPSCHLEQTVQPKARFPLNQWVKLQMYLDWNGADGAVKVWLDDRLMINAPKVNLGPKSGLEKGHFGLYCGPEVNELTMYNDDLSVETIPPEAVAAMANEAEANSVPPSAPVSTGRRKSITGTIKAVRAEDKAVVLSLPGGYQTIVWLSDETKLILDGKQAKLADLKPGNKARVDLKAESDRYVAVTIDVSQ